MCVLCTVWIQGRNCHILSYMQFLICLTNVSNTVTHWFFCSIVLQSVLEIILIDVTW